MITWLFLDFFHLQPAATATPLHTLVAVYLPIPLLQHTFELSVDDTQDIVCCLFRKFVISWTNVITWPNSLLDPLLNCILRFVLSGRKFIALCRRTFKTVIQRVFWLCNFGKIFYFEFYVLPTVYFRRSLHSESSYKVDL